MSTRDKSSSKKKPSLFRRLNLRLPWLKLVAVILIGVIIILDLLDLTISKSSDLKNAFPTTPMSKHVKATERVLKGKKLVALTFDDGPSPSTTPALLDILSEKSVLATFFMLGNMAQNNPGIVKRIEREGHEVASHTMYHQNLVLLSRGAVQSDVNEAKTVFSNILGHTPKLTRPPYGNFNDAVFSSTNTPLILWSVDPQDWRNKDASTILGITLNQVHDGAIILLHDIYPTTVEAVSSIVDTLRDSGYEFTTVSELAEIRDVDLSSGEYYYNFLP
ncbi:polysaccharide deacetylase family protein [Candidatus Saccharibacteria bacterium]|nr:polysaccharide deacetylase family protein [Candidatus Saccharibacteria bacterium]